jgi:hypothetical protein
MTASITVPRMHSDAEGECCFDSYDVLLTLQDVAPLAAPFCTSAPVDATRYIFLRVSPGWVGDLHPTPNPRLVICLSGSLHFVGSGGASGTPVERIIGSIDAAQFQECNPARLAAFTWSKCRRPDRHRVGEGVERRTRVYEILTLEEPEPDEPG